MCTRMVILLAATGLSLAGAADAALAAPQAAYSDGYGYDTNHVFDDGNGYTGADTSSNGSTDGFQCSDSDAYDAYGNCGWYNGFFYPGFGAFVFDRHHHRHRMTSRQHNHFTRQALGPNGGRGVGFGSSGGFRRSISQPPTMPRNGGVGARSGFGGGMFGGSFGARRP
jgi:hypothetical protein